MARVERPNGSVEEIELYDQGGGDDGVLVRGLKVLQ